MSAHSIFSPSKSPMWLACAAAMARQAPLPPEESGPAAQWGTDSHAYLEKGVNLGIPPQYLLAPEASADEREKAECAMVAWQYVSDIRVANPQSAVQVEMTVNAGSVARIPNVSGSADLVVVTNTMLEVIDLKTGRHIVEPTSSQLLIYLLGALNAYWPDRYQPCPFVTFRSTVVQPRAPHKAGPIRSVDAPLTALMELEKQIAAAVREASAANPIATPGDAQCRWCRVRGDCPELAARNSGVIQESIGPETVELALAENRQAQIPEAELGRLLDMEDSVVNWFAALRAEALKRTRTGHVIPGWKQSKANKRPAWRMDKDDIKARLKGMRGVKYSVCVEDKLLTPLQVMHAIPEAAHEKVEKLWHRPEGGTVLVRDTDPRTDTGEWIASIKQKEVTQQ